MWTSAEKWILTLISNCGTDKTMPCLIFENGD